jgi:signal transduction histidine kinase
MNERIQRQERLLEITRNLSASLDFEPFLQTVLSAASELVDCEWASLLEYDEAEKQLRFLAVPWFHRDMLKSLRVPVEGSIAGWVFKNGAPLIVPEAQKEPRHFKTADQLTGYQTNSLVAVPVAFKGRVIGVIEAVNKTHSANYTEEDVLILETLASQTAIAMQNQRLVQRVEKSLDESARLDRMKSEFIAITSHELRTPLGLILGHATFLHEVIGEEHKPQLDIIIRNATRLKDIIEGMSSVDNFQNGMSVVRHRNVSMRRLVEEVVDSFSSEAKEKRINLVSKMGGAELEVDGDSEKIGIALSNLVKNALTFTDEGGRVVVVADQVPGYVKISVVDNGVGIPPGDIPHVFERFFQVESHLTRKHGGMGLGLSIAKAMVEMHGGRIWAESIEGKGSNFIMLLPLDTSQVQAAQRVFTA